MFIALQSHKWYNTNVGHCYQQPRRGQSGLEIDMEIVPQKRCSKCGETKALSEFYRDRAASDGLTYRCKPCLRSAAKTWRQVHPERQAQNNRQWVSKHRDQRQKQQSAWYLRNQGQQRERVRQWRVANREHYIARHKRYVKRHPEKIKAIQNRRRARLMGNGGRLTEQEWSTIKLSFNNTCLRCGRCEPEISLSMDHVIPLSRGGRHEAANIQPLCFDCNRWKNARSIDFRSELTPRFHQERLV